MSERVWDQRAIGEWADRTLGKATNAAVVAALANVEMAELLWWLAQDPEGLADNTADEAADVAILLFRLAHRCHFDLLEAVARKMEINVTRRRTPEARVALLEESLREAVDAPREVRIEVHGAVIKGDASVLAAEIGRALRDMAPLNKHLPGERA